MNEKLLRQIRLLIIVVLVVLLLPYLWGGLDFLASGWLTVWAQTAQLERVQDRQAAAAYQRWQQENK